MWYVGDVGKTPIGRLWLALDEIGLVAVAWADSLEGFLQQAGVPAGWQPGGERAALAANQIREYLAGMRRTFDLPIQWGRMSPFQRMVLQATVAIPYGRTRTYGELAASVGRPRAARAVGRAQATNPIPIVIPCHRVVGASGHLTGYGGGAGLETKVWLLKLEGAWPLRR